MSTHKAGGKAGQHVSPSGKRLGAKVSDGKKVKTGEILVRQRGTTINAGDGVKSGRDYTLYALRDGVIKFTKKIGKSVISVLADK